jgi:ATP-dependent Clp protease adaptor protein ClpS
MFPATPASRERQRPEDSIDIHANFQDCIAISMDLLRSLTLPARQCDILLIGIFHRTITMAATAFPDLDTESETRTRRQPPYAVVLHNDDHNGMEFVVGVLQTVFKYELEKCIQLMMEAHETGRSIVWVGSLEVAELKADQIHSCGRDPRVEKAEPLRVTIEEME